ncbi:Phosphatidylinositol 3-kinase catalytic subunit type [Paragonimus heterotremus]|uniref:Phosphatidylinositol 3-kinase catalytic subunit type 3 n=1 Tax=Paragonimus heterotremus TaxID=100268 RepID=A0A8J4SZG9_9TREM|nr:Phosphatidylinositol 3-kinase catalytic subunit type [Paragonimus heterotremus]
MGRMNLSGFHPEKYKTIKGQYMPLACYGELQISYCITKNIPHLNCCVVSPWCQTRHSLDDRTFNETVELSLPYNALYDYNGICFVLTSTFTDEKGAHEQLIAGANMRLFNSKKIFRHGIYEIELHPLEPMGIRRFEDLEKVIRKSEFDAKPAGMDLLNKLLKTSRKHIRNELFETPLDRHTRSDAERAIEEAKRDSDRLFLSVEFQFSRGHPNLNAPVIFERREMDPLVSDARSERWNPVDEKYFKMTRSLRIADVDRKRKPNKETLDRLKEILEQPPARDLLEFEGDLVWQYRFYLAEKFPEIALAKFLLAVRWEYSEQVDQAVELLHQWPIVDTDYVLELLNRQFIHPCVRRFAVVRLETAKDEELLLYLYQLVQALHYENWHDIFSTQAVEIESLVALEGQHSRPQAPEELQRTERPLSSELHAGSTSSSRPPEIGDTSVILSSVQQLQPVIEHKGRWIEALKTDWKEDLATFLLRRAQSSWPIANYLYWFLRLEANKPNSPSNGMYTHVLDRLQGVLYAGDEVRQAWLKELIRQTKFVKDILRLLQSVCDDSGNRPRKIEILRATLSSEAYANLARLDEPLALPLDPGVKIIGIDPSSSSLFKSARRPALLPFILPDGGRYKVIFKHGDDLRRDQLVLQMIELMDVILRKENFDLRLTPYKVLATGDSHGFVQFIESTSLQDLLQQGTVLGFLQQNAPSATDPLGVQKEVMETYIRSCAGYCVITYLLGVGDRHMENLLLTNDGRLFHIDFSFIFGNDPKPMATEVRLTRSMIEAMGGANTSQFSEFWKITFTAFLVLRRHANLFLTLFSLVSNMDVRSTSRDQSSACEFLKERFCINQTEERAVNRLASRMTESIKAIVPDIMERIHVLLQYMRP